MDEFLHAEDFSPGIDSIWDFRKTTSASVTNDDLKEIARYNERIGPIRGPKWKAALVVSTDLFFGLARMFEAFADSAPNEIKVFRNMEEATAWITSK
jgi:hypothetical protein